MHPRIRVLACSAAKEPATATTALTKRRHDLTWMNEELARLHEQARAAKVPESWLGR